MKLTVLQENFYKAISTAGRSVDSRASLPILSNILLQTEKGRLKITGTNTEMTIEVYCGADITEEGQITIPIKVLTELVAAMKTEKIEIETDTEKATIKMRANKFKSEMVGQSAEGWPALEGGEGKTINKDETEIEIEKELFEEIVNKVAFAAATDESRPQLTGVLFNTTEGGVDIVATDGYRLAKINPPANGEKIKIKKDEEKEQAYLIPARAIAEAGRIWKEEKRIKIKLEKNTTKFVFEDTILTTRLLEGKYPEYQKVVPAETTNKVTVLRDELLGGVKAAGIMARDSANIIKFKIQNEKTDPSAGGLKITANTPQVGSQETEIETVKNEGESWEIAFNYRFVLDFLSASAAEKIIIGVNTATQPAVFWEEGNKNYLYVVMPVRVQQ